MGSIITTTIELVAFLLHSLYLIIRSVVAVFTPSSYEPKKNVKGEIVLVTGGGGGLGQLLSLRLAKLGATVVVWDISKEGVEATVNLVKGIGGKAFGYICDLANSEDVYRVAKQTQDEVGHVTILINNAGVFSGHTILDLPDKMIKRTFDVNIVAHFWTVKAFLPNMLENNHGHIVTIASMAGLVGVPKLVDYCCSKFAAVGFDEALKVELEGQGVKGIKTTVVCPYFISSTGMFKNVNSFVPTLKPNDVADRVILGLLREEDCVMIPKRFQPLLTLKTLVPFDVFSNFIRMLVPDAAPQSTDSSNNQINKPPAVDSASKTNGTVISSSVSQMNQRISTEGKDL